MLGHMHATRKQLHDFMVTCACRMPAHVVPIVAIARIPS
jgi:hypothetical protein